MISVIDYGMGNLQSVSNSLNYLDIPFIITNNKEEIKKSKAILIPGVGAFYDAMKNMKDMGLDKLIKEESRKKAILGICLGMQILFEKGQEVKETEGLGLLKGTIKKLEVDYKVPHIGWNNIKITNKNEILKDIDNEYVYFVHSYYADTLDPVVDAYCDYGIKIPAIVSKGNIYGMQFHPEKSGAVGMRLLRNFWEGVK
ncbi:MAG: imidazole glycerol phosphate synthase subunit HisH [Anaeromicrobium sp.]|jgi:glutamine amidotransferase|uniref:imidazole glycerol phosphate synthase subunit HisH n=1 Tax=Anaeromicrobium sp. TaxID=1929132 RepID=UPI0025F612DE|nr:imidazole glycerol phosphate synthase subunit HisH [Anaeromicrobium sp.]MCT4593893.1 imidazole glycerol phosphate synthase subunit HisH [Anaeromicrobium sp.]